jgi:hypothetical protein
MRGKSKFLSPAMLMSIAILAFAHTSQGDPTAVFEVRLAPSSPDAVLDVNNPADNILNLELWVTLGNGPLPGNVLAYSFYLNPSVDGVIGYKSGSFANVTAFQTPQMQGTDDQPLSGALSRGVADSADGLPFSLGETELATFSVTALSPGQVSYSFVDSPPNRPWAFNFELSDAIVSAASPAMTITVVPEPALGIMMLFSIAWMARRGRRFVRR